jgi:hypothetical protein
MKRLIVLLAALLMIASQSAHAGNFPKVINYQGMLTQSDGQTPVEDGTYHLTFKIYGSSSGDDSLWIEHHPIVQVAGGLFNILLGSVTSLDLPFDDTYWLGVKVGNDSEFSPRIQLTSVGYAHRALVADSAVKAISAGGLDGWVDDGTVVRLEDSTDKVGIGTSNPVAPLHIDYNSWAPPGSSAGLIVRNTAVSTSPHWGQAEIALDPSGLGASYVLSANDEVTKFRIYENNTLRFMIDSLGNVHIWGGLCLPGSFGPDDAYVGHRGNYVAFGHPGVSEDFIGYKNNTFYFKDSPGGGDISDPNMVIGGNVGIGTTSPLRQLQISSDINGIGFDAATSSPDAGVIRFGDNTGWKLHFGRSRETMGGQLNTGATGALMTIVDNGNVGIGTTNPGGFRLAVEGKIGAREVVVTTTSPWPDFVFHEDYNLPSLEELEQNIKESGQLPGIPSAEQVKKSGISLGEMQSKLLQKIEELTLHMIKLSKENEALKKRIVTLELTDK